VVCRLSWEWRCDLISLCRVIDERETREKLKKEKAEVRMIQAITSMAVLILSQA
jgi:hypothetical protein